MKEQIVAILSKPYVDKYVIEVYRQIDRFHVPAVRTYSARYTESNKVLQLLNHFLDINTGVQARIISERIKYWKGNG